MARGGFPSMTALLGLLAVAGYQNRDKISEMLNNRGGSDPTIPGGGSGSRLSGTHDDGTPKSSEGTQRRSGLEGLLGGMGLDSLLGGGLSELSDRFRQNGQAETVDSWVGTGPNRDVGPVELERALGSDTLDEITEQTGLSRNEVLARLSRELPTAVDQYTPQGQLPSTAR